MPEYNQPDTNKTPSCYYCGKPMIEGIMSGTWQCGTHTKGVYCSTGEDEEIDYICIYEEVNGYEYLARHYLPNYVGSKKNMCILDIYEYEGRSSVPISTIIINERMVDRITPENLVSKVKLYLLLS